MSNSYDPARWNNVLLEERKGPVLIMRMNRPTRMNAINADLMDALLDLTQRAAADESVRAVVLIGEGKGFCAGGDVLEGASRKRDPNTPKPADPFKARADDHYTRTYTSHLLHTMPKPTIALVRGAAMGAGMSIALACDYRICSDTAVFRSAFVNNALSGDYGIGYFLTKALGACKAMELIMLSEKVDAAKANALGLVTKLVSDEALEAEGIAFAEKLATGPTIAYAGIKANIAAACEGSLDHYLRVEANSQTRCGFSEDIREAGKSFIEKRPPVYQGK
jgi:2-(1,2-epoxy-1,2-dihydrophenyl)acetyl-CoA isomerase